MRLTFVVLAAVAVATSFVVTNAEPTAKTTTSFTKDVTMMASPVMPEAGNGVATEGRFLRSHRETEYDEGDDKEERKGKYFFRTEKLDKMMSSVDTFAWFRQWKAHGLTPADVFTRLSNKGLYKKYQNLYSMYNRHYDTIKI
ncbi:RxLR effector protein [Phytophthora megakarya]|uniref:RxLR effector protein n=1 Tax=Phytophthora megakarya TaxID=4795 RepID=A0A225W4S3_9STRA|nr:RxLR effector protein [Phytophthora megakarya]